MRAHRRAAMVLGLVLGLVLGMWAAGARALPPSAPPFLGGILDARAELVIVGTAKGVDAYELASGKKRWSSAEGLWPLVAGLDVVAVAAPDAKKPNVLHVRLLRLADGKRAAESKPVTLTAPAAGVVITAWAPAPSRQPDRDRRAGLWRLRWKYDYVRATGIAPAQPQEGQHAVGLLLIDPVTAAVEEAPLEDPPGGPLPLPTGFKVDKKLSYWSWSDWGSGYSTTPRVFRITAGVSGYLSQENGGAHRLLLHRLQPGQAPLAPVPLGPTGYPVVSEDGGTLVVITADAGKPEVRRMYDLARGGAALPYALPAFHPGFQARVAIAGGLLFYVTKSPEPKPMRDNYSSFDRTLVAVDLGAGKERWTAPLAPELQSPPVPGGGIPH